MLGTPPIGGTNTGPSFMVTALLAMGSDSKTRSAKSNAAATYGQPTPSESCSLASPQGILYHQARRLGVCVVALLTSHPATAGACKRPSLRLAEVWAFFDGVRLVKENPQRRQEDKDKTIDALGLNLESAR